MDVDVLVQTAFALFTVAALGGLVLAGVRLQGRPAPPSWLAMVHGVLAAAGLTLLIFGAVTVGIAFTAEIGLVLLLIAAVAGAALRLLYHDNGVPLPVGLVFGHAGIAVTGYLLLLVAVVSG
jgi:hypothetical protein